MSQTARYIQRDENSIVELCAKWDIEYARSRDIPGDWLEPPEPGDITILSRTLVEVLHFYNKQGYELKDPDWASVERHLCRWLADDELVKCCEKHWESLDEEGRRAA